MRILANYTSRVLLCFLLLLPSALADTHRWVGGAVATTDEYTVTIAGTWTSNPTLTITDGNGHDVTLTVGTGTTTDNVAEALCNMINASTVDGNLESDETRTAGCQSVKEFTEMVATVAGSVVTVKAKQAGLPISFTVSETAGSGTATKATVIAATGPNFFDNADNWQDPNSNGVLPANNDTILFNSGNVDCLYGLDYARADPNNILTLIPKFSTDYTGSIGLPYINAAGYSEYRTRQLQLAATLSPVFDAGTTGVRPAGTIRLDFNYTSTGYQTLTVHDVNDLELYGGSNSTILFYKGKVTIDPEFDPPSTAATFDAGISVGGRSLPPGDTQLKVGSGVAANGTSITITQYSGIINYHGALWTDASNYFETTVLGGEFNYTGTNTEAVTIKGGTFSWTHTTTGNARDLIDVWTGGTFDVSKGTPTKTYTGGLTAHGGATLILGGATPTITLDGCEEDDVTIIR